MATVSKTVPFGIAGSNPALGVTLSVQCWYLFYVSYFEIIDYKNTLPEASFSYYDFKIVLNL